MVKIEHVLKAVTYLCVACGYASVMFHVTIYSSVGFLGLLGFSAYLDLTGAPRIPRWTLNTISVLVLALAFTRVTPEYLVEPVLDALVILVTIKLLEDKQFRDYMQIYAMCMFLLIGSTFISLSITFLAYFSMLATLSTIALILLAYFSQNAEMAVRPDSVAKIVIQSLVICAISIPASALFFIILPRTNFPLFSLFNKEGLARSGFSDKVSLGEVSEIQEDNSVIFRAEMEPVDEGSLYWRGIVLDELDGLRWKSGARDTGQPVRPPDGKKVIQTIYLEPYGNIFLFALDKPTSISLGGFKRWRMQSFGLAKHADTLTFSLKEHLDERIKYRATSVLTDTLLDDAVDHQRYLQLPEGFSPKIRELLKSHDTSRGEAELVKSLLKFLKWGEYGYSLDNLPVSPTPLEDFLLVHKQGNCEYFASSLAVLLRMSGIPARLIGGYRGGFYNKTGGYYLVLQKNAHVWVEAHIAGQGWIRLDPTPYSMASPAATYEKSVFMRLNLLLDTFNYYWYKFVINYDLGKQVAMIDKIRSTVRKHDVNFRLGSINFKKFLVPGALLLATACLAAGILRGRTGRDRKLIARFARRMYRRGYRRRSGEGLEEFVERIEEADLRDRASRFVTEFEAIFYRDHPLTRPEAKRLDGLIKKL